MRTRCAALAFALSVAFHDRSNYDWRCGVVRANAVFISACQSDYGLRNRPTGSGQPSAEQAEGPNGPKTQTNNGFCLRAPDVRIHAVAPRRWSSAARARAAAGDDAWMMSPTPKPTASANVEVLRPLLTS
jgi:hypothetical protein